MIIDAMMNVFFTIITALIHLLPSDSELNLTVTSHTSDNLQAGIYLYSIADYFIPVFDIMATLLGAIGVYVFIMIYRFIRAVIP